MRCYSQIWDKISKNVAAALKAADQYDQFADAGYGVLGLHNEDPKLVSDLIKQLNAALNPPKDKKTLGSLWSGTVKLLKFGETLTKALSKSNRDAVQKAIDDLVQAF